MTATERDIDAARALLGSHLAIDDDPKMFHRTGGRLAGAASCVHSFPEYGTRGVFRHHVFSPDREAPLDVVGDIPCVCGFAERSMNGMELHQACWLSKGN